MYSWQNGKVGTQVDSCGAKQLLGQILFEYDREPNTRDRDRAWIRDRAMEGDY